MSGEVFMNSTEEKISQAFLSLYSEKPIEKISIKSVSEKAGINRGTFYDHYLDIYDLRDRLENEFMKSVEGMVGEVVKCFVSGDIADTVDFFGPFYEEHRQMIDIFLVKRLSSRFQAKIKTQSQKTVCTFLGFDFDDLTSRQRCILEYVASGQLGLAAYWFSQNFPIEAEDIVKLVRDINTAGPWTTLLKTGREANS